MELSNLLPVTGIGGLIVAIAYAISQIVKSRREAKLTGSEKDSATLRNASQANAILLEVLNATEKERETQRAETDRLRARTTDAETQLAQVSRDLADERAARSRDRAAHDCEMAKLREEIAELRRYATDLKAQLESTNDG